MESVCEDSTMGSSHDVQDMIFVALGNVREENTSTLLWALKHCRRKNLCILHVHQPAQEIRVLGAKVRVGELDEHQVRAHREAEKKEMDAVLNDYLDICLYAGVRAETVNVEMENIERGIVKLIAHHGIIKLVMGAASDKHYSKRMEKLQSKKAIFVRDNAPISCHIWFVCKGRLIVTREGVSENSAIQARSSLDTHLSKSFSHGGGRPRSPVRNPFPGAISSKSDITTTEGIKPSSQASKVIAKSQRSQSVRLTNPFQDLIERALSWKRETLREREKPPPPPPPSSSSSSSSSFSSSSSPRGRAAGILQTLRRSQSSDCLSPLSIDSSGGILRDETNDDETVASSRCESIDEMELLLEKESESFNEKQLESRRQELEKLKIQRDQVIEELRIAKDQKVKLESQIADSDRKVTELVEMKVLSAAQQLVDIQKEVDELRLRKIREEEFSPRFFSVFSTLDIESATGSFSPSMKIGEGTFGNVYKGLLRKTRVAIKRFHFHSLEGQNSSDFQREVDVLSKVRHPNLVTLIGACPEASSLIFEYLPNGSLEDRLTCKDGTPPLSWKTRIRIAQEICSALIFLHSNKPDAIVHGDLKPSNILLDVNFVSKLGDFGIASFISRDDDSNYTTTICCIAHPKGTFAYIDPEFLTTGELTPKADVYSFGVVVLQLLTGRPALWLAKKVQLAMAEGTLKAMLDASAGDWPLVQAEQLAQMALRCCEINRKNRPNLELEVWKLLSLLEIQI
ncbi:U-box domain-containing protein 33-like [Macadamia integrifolia]|uniref:U-box domain-containing protein 33-like n=1 Tax=Macadamia integrifolia TaxID=60698 RepID=UPI001C52BB22|nr:U-box domain-containing protein 33-like [Macadamia integrifolia]